MPGDQAAATISGPQDFAEAFKVPRETIHRLTRYAELLTHWQSPINLVAPTPCPALVAPFRRLGPARALRRRRDSGSISAQGPAFPGWWWRSSKPGGRISACIWSKATGKKCAFLAEVARETEGRCGHPSPCASKSSPKALRASRRTSSPRGRWRLPHLFDLAAPFFGPATRGLFLKGRDAEAEIEAAKADWDFAAACIRA